MKKKEILIAAAAVAAITAAVAVVVTTRNKKNRLKHVANEGYETAHDILYPLRRNKKKKLRFGPVHP